MLNEESQDLFAQFLAFQPAAKAKEFKSRHVSADFFCADEVNANLCAELVLQGEKQATCGLAYWYDNGDERHPEVGDCLIVQNWSRKPLCIVELTEVQRLAFKDIDAEFAHAEGEGDKSYRWWRKVHWDFFSNELTTLGMSMSDDAEIVAERFEKVWPLDV